MAKKKPKRKPIKKNTQLAKTGKQVKNYHDTTFKDLMGRKEVAQDFIAKNLPAEVLDIIDLEGIERKDGTYVGKELEETFSDLIYGTKIRGREAYIALLFEHKSSPDKHTVFQVAKYILDVWMRKSKDNSKEFPVVIPMVFYHGKDKWNYRTDIRDLIPEYNDLPEFIKERMPTMKHELIDLQKDSDESLDRYRPVVRFIFSVFKIVPLKNEDKTLEVFVLNLDYALMNEEDKEVVIEIMDRLLVYMAWGGIDVSEEKLLKKVAELGEGEKEETIMTILEERELRGEQRGIEKGMQAGELKRAKETAREMLGDGLPVETVAKYTKLTLEEVNQIKKEMMN